MTAISRIGKVLGLAPLKAESGELLHLDFLRFIAAAGIVLCHSAEFFLPAEMRGDFRGRTAGLPLFVDVFFVISGFVISYVYIDSINNGRDFLEFMKRRLARLYPLHALTLVLSFAIVVMIGVLGFKMNNPYSLDFPCLATTATLTHAMYDCGGHTLNTASWSISAELVMYALFPLFLALTSARASRLAGLFVAAAAVAIWASGGVGEWTSYLDVRRAFPSFIFGMLLFAARQWIERIRHGLALMIVGAGVIILGSFLILPMWVLIPIAYAVPIFAIAADGRGSPPPSICRLAPLGQLTYSIYMIHGLVIFVVLNGIGDKVLHLPPAAMIPLALVVYAIILLASWMSLQWFETPFRRLINRIPVGASKALSVH